jgi:hypothetical protein
MVIALQTGVAVGRMVADRMSPANLAAGEGREAARRGHRPETYMAVFLSAFSLG